MILGSLMRLYAIIRKVKAAVARAMPRTLRRAMPPMVLAYPNASSMRLRMRKDIS